MLNVRFYDEDSTGTIVYYEVNKELRVSHPKAQVRKRVRNYLTSSRAYVISTSHGDTVGQKMKLAIPTQDMEHMEMALSEMNSEIGFWVDWSNTTGPTSPDIKEKGPIIRKSIDGKEEYEIIDITKSKGKREGLIQTVITYVRNGKTITRKQWVRSEYAQHAKKNEEEKKEAMIRKQEKEEEKKKRELEELQESDTSQDDKERRKLEKRQMEYTHGGLEHMDEVLKEYYKAMKKKRMEEAREKKDLEDEFKSKKRQEEKKEKEAKRTAFGQSETTMADNRRELKIR